MPSNFKALAGASGGEPTDTNFKNVTLLLHGDGSNGAQNNTFLDSSTNNFTITRNGNTTQGSFSPYGSNWSNYFDGSGDYLSAASNAAFDLGSSDFTVECWFNANSFAAGFGLISRYNYTSVGLGWMVAIQNSTTVRFVRGNDIILDCTVSAMSTGVWYHVAAVRNGSTLTVYLNGVQVGQSTGISNFTDAATALQIGRTNTATNDINGYISNVRVVKGTAVYTSAFTPSTTPLTAITNTSLLTCAYNRFRDASTNNFTITRNGDVKVTNFAPFAPSAAYSTTANGGSAYFDGSGDYLTSTSANTANAMGTGDWTVEGWVYRTSGAADMVIFDTVGISAGSADYIRIFVNTGGGVSFWKYSTATTTTTSAMPIGAWSHFAVVRESGSIKIYVNGVQGNTTYTDTGSNYTCSASRPAIGINGYDAAANAFAGYLSNIRAVKGTAVYTANFTPPTSPLTSITNTGLLINATNAAIFDNSMKNDLETVGNAQISTSVKKFGTGSMAFDGTGDYLTSNAANDLYAFGTGNFTIEMWFNLSSFSSLQILYDSRPTSTDGLYPLIYVASGGGSVVWQISATAQITGTATLSTGVWYHLAVSRSSGSTRMFLNGTQIGSTYADTNAYLNSGTTRPFIGGSSYSAGTLTVNGYIDDLRITNGVARYTANFTAPTAPFPNK